MAASENIRFHTKPMKNTSSIISPSFFYFNCGANQNIRISSLKLPMTPHAYSLQEHKLLVPRNCLRYLQTTMILRLLCAKCPSTEFFLVRIFPHSDWIRIGTIWSFFWSVFSCIWTEYGEIRSISPYSVRMWENTDQKKLRILTLFTQWWFRRLHSWQVKMMMKMMMRMMMKMMVKMNLKMISFSKKFAT